MADDLPPAECGDEIPSQPQVRLLSSMVEAKQVLTHSEPLLGSVAVAVAVARTAVCTDGSTYNL